MNNEINNEMNRTNKSRYKVDKKMLSRVGFALTATALIDFIIQNGVGVICKLYFPAIFDYKYFSLILMIVSSYMIAIPIGLLILKSVIKANESAEDKKLGFFEMVLWCVVAVPMMYIGSYIGQIINTVLNTVIGAPSSSALGEFIDSLPLWLVFLIVVVLGPFMEELLFRRGVTEALRPWGWKMAVIIGGVAFGLFLDILLEDRVRRHLAAFGVVRHGQQTVLLLHDDERIVFVDDTQFGVTELNITTPLQHLYHIARLERSVMTGLNTCVHRHATLTEQLFDAGAGHTAQFREQKRHQFCCCLHSKRCILFAFHSFF